MKGTLSSLLCNHIYTNMLLFGLVVRDCYLGLEMNPMLKRFLVVERDPSVGHIVHQIVPVSPGHFLKKHRVCASTTRLQNKHQDLMSKRGRRSVLSERCLPHRNKGADCKSWRGRNAHDNPRLRLHRRRLDYPQRTCSGAGLPCLCPLSQSRLSCLDYSLRAL